MKKTLFLSIVTVYMILLSFSCTTEKHPIYKMPNRIVLTEDNIKDSILTLPLIEIKNQDLYPILDVIIALNGKCVHAGNGEQTWFSIWGENKQDTVFLDIYANQYFNAVRIEKKARGAFYYKNLVFVVATEKGFDNFFKASTDSIRIITYYPRAINYCPSFEYSYPDPLKISYYYLNNQFVFREFENSCTEYYPVYHKIKKGETLDTIAKNYWVSKDKIIALNNLKGGELPKKGKIRIQ